MRIKVGLLKWNNICDSKHLGGIGEGGGVNTWGVRCECIEGEWKREKW